MFSPELEDGQIAYFTMEIGIENGMNSYSGGLGVLAGDTIKTFADLDIPAVGVTQLNKRGYCHQELDGEGNQIDEPEPWDPEQFLEKLPVKTSVRINGDEVKVSAWKKEVQGYKDSSVPVIFLDTDIEENEKKYRDITNSLYKSSDYKYRLYQEIVLGIGGARILDEMGYEIGKYHMNESHSSLLTLELLNNFEGDREEVREKCVFTTHTPVKAGHDEFSYDIVEEVMGDDYLPVSELKELSKEESLHMTLLAMNLSSYINAVSKRHEDVTKSVFSDHSIDSITNGIHIPTWVSDSFEELYDDNFPGWRKDPYKLKHCVEVPGEDIWNSHLKEKEKLIEEVNDVSDVDMNSRVFTIGFARRAAPYKRADLIFHNKERLIDISQEVGDFQIIFAGKAHPQAGASKDMIRSVYDHMEDVRNDIKITYIEDYDMKWGDLLTSGVDLWLNNPKRGREACGTSGMKAACNGVPQLSTLDGWWIEGHLEDVTGWEIGGDVDKDSDEDIDRLDSSDIYKSLEEGILPKFYTNRKGWTRVMKNAIAFNASYFNTHRMVREYILNAYS